MFKSRLYLSTIYQFQQLQLASQVTGIDPPTSDFCLFLSLVILKLDLKLWLNLDLLVELIQICFKRWSTQKPLGNSGVVMVEIGQR